MKKILPGSVEIKYNAINIDGIFVATVIVINYEAEIEMFKTIQKLIDYDEIEISFHVKRQNNYEILKRLTSIIAQSSSELSSISKNQIDANVLDNVKNNAVNLRRKIQIDNQQIYLLSTYIVVKAGSLQEVTMKSRNIVNKLYSNGIIAKPANFRQKEAYLAATPLLNQKEELAKNTDNIFTEGALGKLFPFYNNSVIFENGIIVGNANNNVCSIDIFSENNNNYNMCVFGTSGAGKSYFIKLMIMRNAYNGIHQIIIDPEGEYTSLVKSLGGSVYTIDNYNPFEISEGFTNNKDFFNMKVEQIVGYVQTRFGLKCYEKIKEAVKKTYNDFGINHDRNSLFLTQSKDKLYTKPKYRSEFPNLNDLKQRLDELRLDSLVQDLSKKGNTSIICFNLKGNSLEKIQQELKIYLPKVYELVTTKTIIYFDEVWKGLSSNDRYTVETLYNMFKTLRKKKAGIVAISQDICDLFNLDNGNFGKSILNNSNIKMFFKMEWKDIETLDRMLLKKEDVDNIKILTRGNAYVSLGNTNFNLEIKSTKYEHKLIEGGIDEKSISCYE